MASRILNPEQDEDEYNDEQENQQASNNLALVVSTGDRKKSFSLYKMPEF